MYTFGFINVRPYTPAVDKGRPAALGEFGAAGGQLVSTSTMVKMRQKTMQLV